MSDGGSGDDDLASSPAEFAAAQRRLITVVVPLAATLQFIKSLASGNFAYASLGLIRDGVLTPASFGVAAGAYYAALAACSAPSNLVLRAFGGSRWWLVMQALGWSFVTGAQAAGTRPAHFIGMRVVLGALQSGCLPATWHMLTQTLPPSRLPSAFSWLTTSFLAVQLLGPLVATGLLAMEGVRGLRGWQWLFIIEAIPSVIFAALLAMYAVDDVRDARWLTLRQRSMLHDDLQRQPHKPPALAALPRNPLRLVLAALRLPRLLAMFLVGFFVGMGGYSIIFFQPLMIQALLSGGSLGAKPAAGAAAAATGHHYNPLAPIALSAIPYALGAAAAPLMAWSSERRRELPLHAGIPLALSGPFLAAAPAMATSGGAAAGFVGVVLFVVLFSSSNGLVLTVASTTAKGEGQLLGLPLYSAMASLGGLAGPALAGALLQATGGFTVSCVVLGAPCCLAGLVVASLHFWGLHGPKRQQGAADEEKGATSTAEGGSGEGAAASSNANKSSGSVAAA